MALPDGEGGDGESGEVGRDVGRVWSEGVTRCVRTCDISYSKLFFNSFTLKEDDQGPSGTLVVSGEDVRPYEEEMIERMSHKLMGQIVRANNETNNDNKRKREDDLGGNSC
ncbi:hypothetical protein Tco_0316216 [Tanacetum coccineum]